MGRDLGGMRRAALEKIVADERRDGRGDKCGNR